MTKAMQLATVLLAVLLLAVPGKALADDFDFHLDPGIFGGYFTDVDTESSKFEEYRDLGAGFTIPKLHLTGEDDKRVFDFLARNVGRRDARYTLGYDVSGAWGLEIDYNKIPHRFGNNGAILWTRTADGVYELPDAMQESLQNAIENQFNTDPNGIDYGFLKGLLDPYLAVANETDLGLQRDRTRARLDIGKMGRLAWSFELTHENREGTRPFGASLGFGNVDELPEPIDYDTTGVEVMGEWNAAKESNGGARFGYRYNKFENNTGELVWDNPFRYTDSTDSSAYSSPGSRSIGGPVRGRFDLAPDNEANTIFADGRARLGDKGWWSGSLNYSVLTQDDTLLAYTTNTAIEEPFDATNPANLPAHSADAEVRLLNFRTGVGARFGGGFSCSFDYSYRDYDNQSPRIAFPGYVRFDAVWEEVGRITVPYAYTQQNVRGAIDWEFGGKSSLGLAYTWKTFDRDFREISTSDEGVAELTFDTRAVDWLSLRAKLEHGDRSIGSYETEAQEFSFIEPEGINNQPGMRKYDEAARNYDAFNLTTQFLPSDAFTIAVSVTGRMEDYDESQFGLISDDIVQFNVEFGYDPSEDLSFFIFAHHADRENILHSRQSGADLSTNVEDNWDVTFDEATDTAGLGLNAKLGDDWRLMLNGSWSRSDGEADFFSPPGGTPDLATDIGNYEDVELFMASLGVQYDITHHATVGVGYTYEDYTSDSFIRQALQDYLPATLLLNSEDGDYTAHIVTAKLKVSF